MKKYLFGKWTILSFTNDCENVSCDPCSGYWSSTLALHLALQQHWPADTTTWARRNTTNRTNGNQRTEDNRTLLSMDFWRSHSLTHIDNTSKESQHQNSQEVNLIVPGDNGRGKERKKNSKEIIFSSDTINMTPSQWILLIPAQGSLPGQEVSYC